MLGLIRRYLEAGIMANGVVWERHEGTLQGGSLSPLLANVLLDDVDQELEKRGLAFVRYAEDLNVYVRSKRAGEDAMQLLRRLYGQLRLRINEAKSAVDRPWNRTFLGYSFWVAKGREVKRKVASNALDAIKNRVRAMPPGPAGEAWRRCLRSCGAISPDGKAYFRLADTPSIFNGLDRWIRRRRRAAQLKQWKRGTTVYRELRARGVPDSVSRVAAA